MWTEINKINSMLENALIFSGEEWLHDSHSSQRKSEVMEKLENETEMVLFNERNTLLARLSDERTAEAEGYRKSTEYLAAANAYREAFDLLLYQHAVPIKVQYDRSTVRTTEILKIEEAVARLTELQEIRFNTAKNGYYCNDNTQERMLLLHHALSARILSRRLSQDDQKGDAFTDELSVTCADLMAPADESMRKAMRHAVSDAAEAIHGGLKASGLLDLYKRLCGIKLENMNLHHGEMQKKNIVEDEIQKNTFAELDRQGVREGLQKSGLTSEETNSLIAVLFISLLDEAVLL